MRCLVSEKKDEKYRNIDFGYTSNVITKESCKISDISKGDLVMINPNYYHQVTKILGETPRITLGMFLGIYNKNGGGEKYKPVFMKGGGSGKKIDIKKTIILIGTKIFIN